MLQRNSIIGGLLLLAYIMLAACKAEPELVRTNSQPQMNKISIAYLKSLYGGVPIIVGQEVYVEGWVTSSDRVGNMKNVITVQDNSGGVALLAEYPDYFKDLPIGQCVQIYCNSLIVGAFGRAIQLGVKPRGGDYQVAHIPHALVKSVVRRLDSTHFSEPYQLAVSELSNIHISCAAAFQNLTPIEEEHGENWCEVDPQTGKPTDTNRHFTDNHGDTLAIRTSRYSLFAMQQIPSQSRDYNGIVGYFNGKYQLTLIEMPN